MVTKRAEEQQNRHLVKVLTKAEKSRYAKRKQNVSNQFKNARIKTAKTVKKVTGQAKKDFKDVKNEKTLKYCLGARFCIQNIHSEFFRPHASTATVADIL